MGDSLLRFAVPLLAALVCSWMCAPSGEAAGGADASYGVVSKYRLNYSKPCTNSSGGVVADGSSWSTGGGTCDLNTCYRGVHDGLSYYYVIRRTCRQILDNENPEYGGQSSNCVVKSNPALPYPYCCSYLHCENRPAAAATTPAPACSDISRNASCFVWGSVYRGCVSGSALYNFTSKYCRRYCAFC